MEAPQQHCSHCEAALPADTRIRKRLRSRKCQACNNIAAAQRRKQDPILLLHHRWRNNCKKHWPNASAQVLSREAVQHVWERWDKQCVVTGTTDPLFLCVSPMVRGEEPPTVDQLVILTSHQAQSLSRASNEKRMSMLPKAVQEKLKRK